MLDNLKHTDIVLVSHSPRRRKLLKKLGLHFHVTSATCEENFPSNLKGEEIPLFLSNLKAENCPEQIKDNTLIIAADTVVLIDGQILGKPVDKNEAMIMLRQISGTSHQVITGVTLKSIYYKKSFSSTTRVNFYPLNEDEINYYVKKYKPIDKAGAYGIQEWIGLMGIENIEGCFYNVMGLPLPKLYQELKQWKEVN